MKNLKKILASLTAVFMMLVCVGSVGVSAEAPGTSITIKSPETGHTYTAYQIFAGTQQGDDTTGEYSTLGITGWGTGVDRERLLTALKSSNVLVTDGVRDFADCSSAQDVAEVLAGYANNATKLDEFAKLVNDNLDTKAGDLAIQTSEVDGTQVPTKDTDGKYHYYLAVTPGYYFIKDTVIIETNMSATKYILDVVGAAEINAKTDTPSVEKKVSENTKYTFDGGYGTTMNDVADYEIGYNITFKLYGLIPDTSNYETYEYIFHDTMATGLEFVSLDSVQLAASKDDNATTATVNAANWTDGASDDVIAAAKKAGYVSTATKGCKTFTVSFTDLITVLNSLSSDEQSFQYVVVTYTAKLNASANVGLPGNNNKVYLEYSCNPNGTEKSTTTEDEVVVFTYKVTAKKIDGSTAESSEPTTLNGVKFKLAKNVGTADEPSYEWATVVNGTLTGWATTEEVGTTLTTTNGEISIKGLDSGTYYLKETEALSGYNLPDDMFTITLTATTVNDQSYNGTPANALTSTTVTLDTEKGTVDSTNKGDASVTVSNNKGSELPSTGGMGTTILYVAGGILIIGAAIFFVTNKRMQRN